MMTRTATLLLFCALGCGKARSERPLEDAAPPEVPPYALRDAPGGGHTITFRDHRIEGWLREQPSTMRGQLTKPMIIDTTDYGYRKSTGECVIIVGTRSTLDERTPSAVADDVEHERLAALRADPVTKKEVTVGGVAGRELVMKSRGRPTVTAMREREFVRDRNVYIVFALAEGAAGEADLARCIESFTLK